MGRKGGGSFVSAGDRGGWADGFQWQGRAGFFRQHDVKRRGTATVRRYRSSFRGKVHLGRANVRRTIKLLLTFRLIGASIYGDVTLGRKEVPILVDARSYFSSHF